tara:strand:+ start:357 stop:512 length:156 start_codon:yes stop_codon:yes gene_type:complete
MALKMISLGDQWQSALNWQTSDRYQGITDLVSSKDWQENLKRMMESADLLH